MQILRANAYQITVQSDLIPLRVELRRAQQVHICAHIVIKLLVVVVVVVALISLLSLEDFARIIVALAPRD